MSRLRSSVTKQLKRYREHRAATAPRRHKRNAKIQLSLQWTMLIMLVGVLALLLYSSSAKILSQPIVSEVAVSDPLYTDSVGPLLGAEFLDGNTIEPLINGKEIFPSM